MRLSFEARKRAHLRMTSVVRRRFILRIQFSNSQHRHCEERSDEAIQLSLREESWIASLRSQ
jgi:hypothetical protein